MVSTMENLMIAIVTKNFFPYTSAVAVFFHYNRQAFAWVRMLQSVSDLTGLCRCEYKQKILSFIRINWFISYFYKNINY